MEPGQRNQFNEDKDGLIVERDLLERMNKMIDDHVMQESRIVIDKMARQREEQ